MHRILLIACIICFPLRLSAQDSLSVDDPFSKDAFDEAVISGASTESLNKLEYLPGLLFVAEENGYYGTDSSNVASDFRLYGKASVKVTKGSIGSLYASYNYRYRLYATASNSLLRTRYLSDSKSIDALSGNLAELHFSFDIKKLLFVRIGKQLISWGATYFWSPADFINVQKAQSATVSPFDGRLGKPGLRLHIPVSSANIFLFTDFSAPLMQPVSTSLRTSVAQAIRIDGTFAGINVGTVGRIAEDQPFQWGFDATGSTWGADIYGECALSFVDSLINEPVTQISVGASRVIGQEKTWTIRGEFYYNNRGYADVDQSKLSYGSFTPLYSGKYYAYSEVATTKLYTSILGASLSAYANCVDASFASTLRFSFDIPGVLPFSVYGSYYGGRLDREFSSAFGGTTLQGGLRILAEF